MVKKRMYYYAATKAGCPRCTKEHAEYYSAIFITAPNKKAMRKAGIKFVGGDCAKNTPVGEIEFGKRYLFRAGDPIEFEGVPTEMVKINDQKHLKVIIGDKGEVELYSWVMDNSIYFRYKFLEVIKKL